MGKEGDRWWNRDRGEIDRWKLYKEGDGGRGEGGRE